MRAKTVFASIATLCLLSGFVFATITATAIGSSEFDILPAIAIGVGLTILWSAIMWLLSPVIMDVIQRWVYGARNMELGELGQYRPAVANFVAHVCQKHGIKTPKLKFIDDMTPQAYCYGSYANNARLVVTRGILHYLDDEEAKAVYGHELGHIVHRDFIVMTVASTLLNVLWNIYLVARNIRGRNNSRPFYPVALIALVFWWISQYLVLYLSRTREYYADEFAGAETGNPNALSMALVKIAYGMVSQQPTTVAQKLLGGTRALGISDFKSAGGVGLAYQTLGTGPQTGQQAPAMAGGPQAAYAEQHVGALALTGLKRLEKIMLFDLFNPWASVSEFGSTHPLTGKRIRALSQQSASRNIAPLFSFEQIDASGRALDMSRMYGGFILELFVYFAPYIVGAMFLFVSGIGLILQSDVLSATAAASILFGVGIGLMIKNFYRFPGLSQPTPTTVMDLMCDPYASPLRGRPVILQGTVIGRASAGNKLGEDVMMQDASGAMIMLNYESPFGFIGNMFFAAKRVEALLGQQVQAKGWFRRSTFQLVDLYEAHTGNGQHISSYTRFWGQVAGVIVAVIGLVVSAAVAIGMLS